MVLSLRSGLFCGLPPSFESKKPLKEGGESKDPVLFTADSTLIGSDLGTTAETHEASVHDYSQSGSGFRALVHAYCQVPIKAESLDKSLQDSIANNNLQNCADKLGAFRS